MTEAVLIPEVAGHETASVHEPKFTKFLLLPAELRLKIFAAYLHLETAHNDSTLADHGHLRYRKPCCDVFESYLENARNTSSLAKHLHVDNYNNPCCTWRWPEDLIICDRDADEELTTATFAPWLPALAFANKQLLCEVTLFMLSTTEWFDFKYDSKKPFKIARWFADYLSTFPAVTIDGVATTQGFAAIKRINFPHVKYIPYTRANYDIDGNLDIPLMLKCTQLETIAMSFHWIQLVDRAYTQYQRPRDLEDFLDAFGFRPMLEHGGVKRVYLEGVNHLQGGEGRLACLYRFGEWLVKGYRKRGREVDVHISERRQRFDGRTAGPKLVVEDSEEEEGAPKGDRKSGKRGSGRVG
ncbi:uncharacterized protein J4E78_005886 [Alternaria triticimaculans]|uniref:uncharacterized protein n=1 Tax=Alternaria triticimaculans TaxID=297637 RepID=UPI0020C3AD4F|nr:uncharacterized protein J4E78_005886 [Alternaria triticimaculans]KAI4659458.1 hypothetical protein J4E78_005886 [Alternaria triticimaculans]